MNTKVKLFGFTLLLLTIMSIPASASLFDDSDSWLNQKISDIFNAIKPASLIEINPTIYGDITGNGIITMEDALMIADANSGKININTAQRLASDVNGDNGMTLADAILVAKYVEKKTQTSKTGQMIPKQDPVKVLTTITITPSSGEVNVGNTKIYTSVAKDQIGNIIPAIITWDLSNNNVGSISSSSGVFTAQSGGNTIVYARSGSIVGTSMLTVKAPIISPQPVWTSQPSQPAWTNTQPESQPPTVPGFTGLTAMGLIIAIIITRRI